MTDLAPPDLSQELATSAADICQQAKALVIRDADAFATWGARLQLIKGLHKRIVEHYGPTKRAIDESKKRLLEAEREQLAPLVEAESLVKARLLDFEREQERLRLAEQQRLQAEADAAARREREALEKKAAAAKRPETVAKYQEQAAQVVTPVVSVAKVTPQVAGLSVRKRWRFRITDPALVPREYLMIDEARLRKYGEAMREQAKVPGVEFFTVNEMASSSR